MSERLNLAVAIAVIGLFGANSALAAKKAAPAEAAQAVLVDPAACGTTKISKKLEKPLIAAAKAREAKNWDEALARAREADALTTEKSEYDKYWIHDSQGVSLANLKQYPEAIGEMEIAFKSPCIPVEDKAGRGKLIMQLAYQTKDYTKAIEYGTAIYQANKEPEIGIYLANAYYVKDDYQNTRRIMSEVVSKLEASGKTPDEQSYRILQSACLGLKDDACVAELVEKLVTHYPKPQYWENLVDTLLRASSNDRELLNIMRLADGVQVLKDPAEFIEMSQLSMGQGLPGEAQATLEKGFQKGAFSDAREKDHATRLLTDAKTAVTLDKSTLDKQDAAARSKPTGEADVKLGAAYLSYGDNQKAIEALQRGITKGNVKNPDEAGLLLGIAYLRANNKAEAANAFRTVNKTPMMTRIAKLWLLSAEGPPAAG